MPQISLPIHSYDLRSRPSSSSRLVNCFAEQLPPDARSPTVLVRTPGVKDWTTVGSGPIRGMYAAYIGLTTGQAEYLYVVSGSELYYVTTAGASTLIGNVGSPTRVDMSSNKTHVVVVNEPNGFYWDGTTFGQITDADFLANGGAGDVEFIDDFMLFRAPNNNFFFGSDIGDVTSFDALQFGEADVSPDLLVAMIVWNRLVINFGSKVGEIWENTGIAGFPFERIINGTFDKGCLAAKTVAIQDNTVLWVADDYTVRQLQGINPVRVSTHAVDQFIAKSTVSSLEAFAYDQEGHFFYVLTSHEGTWVLDLTTGAWAERESYGKDNWLPRYHAQFAGKTLVGDSDSNKIGELDFDTHTEWGTTQRMEWTYQPIFADGQRAFHDRFEIVLETGIGTTLGGDPKIMLQSSDDGGRTWQSHPDKSLGPLGERLTRAVWYNLGSSRQRVYKAAVSDPVGVSVTETLVEIRGGRL